MSSQVLYYLISNPSTRLSVLKGQGLWTLVQARYRMFPMFSEYYAPVVRVTPADVGCTARIHEYHTKINACMIQSPLIKELRKLPLNIMTSRRIRCTLGLGRSHPAGSFFVIAGSRMNDAATVTQLRSYHSAGLFFAFNCFRDVNDTSIMFESIMLSFLISSTVRHRPRTPIAVYLVPPPAHDLILRSAYVMLIIPQPLPSPPARGLVGRYSLETIGVHLQLAAVSGSIVSMRLALLALFNLACDLR